MEVSVYRNGRQNGNGYAPYFHGRVVDMFYFPLIHGTYPTWFPFKGGESFTFFSAIFNIADAAISTGLISILVFKRSLFNAMENKATKEEIKPQEEVVANEE